MKKLLPVFCLLSLPLFSLPPKTDAMIRSLVKENTSLANKLDELMLDTNEGFSSAFDAITITRVEMTEELKRQCNNNSRSGAALKVTITAGDKSSELYLSTRGTASGLELCRE